MFLSRKYFGLTLGMLFSISLLLSACGGGGGGGSSSDDSGGTTPISNATQGSQAASSGTTGAQAGTGLSDIVSSLSSAAGGGAFGLSKPINPLTKQNPKYAKIVALNNKVARSKPMMKIANRMKATKAKAKASFAVTTLPAQDPVDCTDGGTVATSGTFDDATGSFALDLSFLDCREEGTQINGPVSMTATSTLNDTGTGGLTMDMTLGNADIEFSIQEYAEINGNRYANLVGVLNSTMTLGTAFNTTSATAGTVALTANGNASFNDFSTTTTIIFAGFQDTSAFDETAGTFSDTLNGAITESHTEQDGTHTAAISFDDLAVSIAGNTDGEAFSYSGTVSVDFTPDTDCGIEGTFTFQTVTPVQYNTGDSCPVAGHLVINSNTHIEFNSDQSVDVTVDGDTVSHASCHDLLDICQVEDFQGADTETVSGDTVTSGSDMLITLTWTDGGVNLSDMDLHVGYYSDPQPTSGPADAVVAYHDQTATFGTASATLDFDDTDGLGPEHVTVSSLPDGRYIIAVNSYDLAESTNAVVTVTVKIGDTVYSFPTHPFTVEDGDSPTSPDPNAWYRVVDLQCISGTCTLVAPNTSLMVHDTTGMFKPKSKTK